MRPRYQPGELRLLEADGSNPHRLEQHLRAHEPMEALRLSDVHLSTEKGPQFLYQVHLVEGRGGRVEIHEQIQIARLPGFAARDRTKDARVSCAVRLECLIQLRSYRNDNLGDTQAIPSADWADHRGVPGPGLAPRAKSRFHGPGLPDKSATKAARKPGWVDTIRHLRNHPV